MPSAHSLSDFPMLPTTKFKASRAPPHPRHQLRKSARVCRPPSFLVNQYKLDQHKLVKTAKTNASAGPMLKFESVDLGSNVCITFQFSSGLYSAIVHPTLLAPPQSWSLGPHQVLFKTTAVEGDLSLTHTKVQIHCTLSSSSSSSNVTLSLFPTTHKLCLQGKNIPPLVCQSSFGENSCSLLKLLHHGPAPPPGTSHHCLSAILSSSFFSSCSSTFFKVSRRSCLLR